MTPQQAAQLFMMARGRGGMNAQEDIAALEGLITQFFLAGLQTGLKKSQATFRSCHKSECRSLTGPCDCFLCMTDREVEELKRI
jgi:hypothetical protein